MWKIPSVWDDNLILLAHHFTYQSVLESRGGFVDELKPAFACCLELLSAFQPSCHSGNYCSEPILKFHDTFVQCYANELCSSFRCLVSSSTLFWGSLLRDLIRDTPDEGGTFVAFGGKIQASMLCRRNWAGWRESCDWPRVSLTCTFLDMLCDLGIDFRCAWACMLTTTRNPHFKICITLLEAVLTFTLYEKKTISF